MDRGYKAYMVVHGGCRHHELAVVHVDMNLVVSYLLDTLYMGDYLAVF